MQAILCADEKWGIGKEGKLLFSLPKDMKFFRETTVGGVVVMGRKTLESFPGGKPLKNRANIVLSRTLERADCIVVRSIGELREELEKVVPMPVFIIGGGEIYRQLLPYCERVLVTRVAADGGADAFFPDLDEAESFRLEKTGREEEDNGYAIRFDEYVNEAVRPL